MGRELAVEAIGRIGTCTGGPSGDYEWGVVKRTLIPSRRSTTIGTWILREVPWIKIIDGCTSAHAGHTCYSNREILATISIFFFPRAL